MVNVLKLFRRRKERIRAKIKRTNKGRVRLSIYRSNCHIYAQLIDDVNSITIASASTKDKELLGTLKSTSNVEAASKVGNLIAARAIKAQVSEVVFDKGGYLYHGRVKALAEAARLSGLKF